MFIIEETLNTERITDIITVILNRPNVIIWAKSSCVDADFDVDVDVDVDAEVLGNKIHALNNKLYSLT